MMPRKSLSTLVAYCAAVAGLLAPAWAGAADGPAASDATPSRPLEFLSWAPTPPMGWNSWDSFGTTITEAQVKQQADFMAEHLLPHGWCILTVDIQWYEPGAAGHSYRAGAPLTMDEWGRLLPAPNRFPSAADGAGFAPLAAYVHGKGLDFGIHLMRGIPRRAVEQNLPVKGTGVRAADIASRADVCPWNPDMYGVDMTKPGAQAYYDSVFDLIASWGVDFVKVDDISRPYHDRQPEIEAIRRAIDRTGRRIILSLSPGETALSAAEHAKTHANMWRISDDFWDNWQALLEQFDRLARWNPHRGPGHWPDADMLPLGVLDLGRRRTHFTPDEQRTLMTLWSIARSPLIHGGDMTKTDDATLALLTNDEVIAVDQNSEDNRPLFARDRLVAWSARVPGSEDRYLALFNTRDRYPLDLSRPAFVSPLVTRATAGHGTRIDVDVRGGSRLVLVVDGGEDGTGWDHALWVEPRLVMEDGSERRLTDERWTQASAGWGDVSTEKAASGGAMTVLGAPIAYGISAHARSVVVYALPGGAMRFRAFGAIDDGALTQPTGASVRFSVHVLPPAEEADPAGVPVSVALSELGLNGPCRVRDLWQRQDIGTVEGEIAPVVAWHGAVLYRLSPELSAGPSRSATVVADELRSTLGRIAGGAAATPEDLDRTCKLLAENRASYERAGSPSQSDGPWFGGFGSDQTETDYQLYWRTRQQLLRLAKNDPRPELGRGMAALVRELRPIVVYNAEWSEGLMEAMGDFAVAAPAAYVRYLADLPTEERPAALGELSMLWEVDDRGRLRETLNALVERDELEPPVTAAAREVIAFLRSEMRHRTP